MSYQKVLTARIQFATLLALAQQIGPSREASLAVTSLQASRMMLGAVAQRLGSPNPYPQADNPASAEILPMADMPEEAPPSLPEDPVAAVKVLRAQLEESIQDLMRLRTQLWPAGRRYGNLEESLFDRALEDAILAKQWLGEQLAVLAGNPVVKPRARPHLMMPAPEVVNLAKMQAAVSDQEAARDEAEEVAADDKAMALVRDVEARLRAGESIASISRVLDITPRQVTNVRDAMRKRDAATGAQQQLAAPEGSTAS